MRLGDWGPAQIGQDRRHPEYGGQRESPMDVTPVQWNAPSMNFWGISTEACCSYCKRGIGARSDPYRFTSFIHSTNVTGAMPTRSRHRSGACRLLHERGEPLALSFYTFGLKCKSLFSIPPHPPPLASFDHRRGRSQLRKRSQAPLGQPPLERGLGLKQ